MNSEVIHWAGYDGQNGELVSWGSSNSLAIVAGQIEKIRSEHRGWMVFQQLDAALETTEDLTSHVWPSREETRLARVANALAELQKAVSDAAGHGVALDALAREARDPLAAIRDLIWPGSGPCTLPNEEAA